MRANFILAGREGKGGGGQTYSIPGELGTREEFPVEDKREMMKKEGTHKVSVAAGRGEKEEKRSSADHEQWEKRLDDALRKKKDRQSFKIAKKKKKKKRSHKRLLSEGGGERGHTFLSKGGGGKEGKKGPCVLAGDVGGRKRGGKGGGGGLDCLRMKAQRHLEEKKRLERGRGGEGGKEEKPIALVPSSVKRKRKMKEGEITAKLSS